MLQKIARLGSRFCEQQKGVLKGPGALFPLRVRQSAYGFFSTAVGPIANAGGVARLLRWGHGEPLSESWVAFCASGPETSLQRLWRSITRLLAGYRAGYALHQLHLPLGSEGGAFGALFNAAFATHFLLSENCEKVRVFVNSNKGR